MKTTLRKTPDEYVYYDFEDYVSIEENVVICGNSRMTSFGDSELISIIEGDYYDDETGYDYETLEQLKKVTGKDWEETTIRGYSQSDWNTVYYVKDEVSDSYLEEIENFYFGKVDEFVVTEDDNEDEHYLVLIPHDVVWEGKESICKYLDLSVETTVIYEDDGYEKVYKYK